MKRFRPGLALILTLILMMGALPVFAETAATYDLHFDNAAWRYDAGDQVYWQVGVAYCANPAAAEYESLGIFVPAAYMTAADNGDGTYTCRLNAEGAVNGYTAATAPVVLPVNTPGYSAMAAPTGYVDGASGYTAAGFIYVSAGCRGRANGYDESGGLLYDGGAPWGVTDLKAAIRYLRYNAASLPGDEERIFSFGMSGGGAQSALLGATGDSGLYAPYLESIGAAMADDAGNALSDQVFGAMCWCPITSLDTADQAYEWNMGQYADTGTRADGAFTRALSEDLAAAYAEYVNELGLTDEDGSALTLEPSDGGIYAAGSYYEYLLSLVQGSLNNFLRDTAFPYTSGGMGGPGGFPGGSGGQRPEMGASQLPDGGTGAGGGDGRMPGGGRMPGDGGMGQEESVTYETAQDYIDSLNEGGAWITYDAAANIAAITSLADFVTHCKGATKGVGAFDALDRSQAENDVFGTFEADKLHFDGALAALLNENRREYAALSGWDDAYVSAYKEDLTSLDSLGISIQVRQNMYNPMYYLSGYYEGSGTSAVARHWRIRTGIEQGDTALTVEANLALALKAHDGVEDVDFQTVWGQGHTQAERSGDSTSNFIAWVNQCCAQ